MKSTMQFPAKDQEAGAPQGVVCERDHWARWVDALRKYQLDGLVGWFLDGGRPFAFLSAQLLYIASPFVGAGIERVGRMLESEDDSRAFAQLLDAGQGVKSELRGGGAG